MSIIFMYADDTVILPESSTLFNFTRHNVNLIILMRLNYCSGDMYDNLSFLVFIQGPHYV